MGLHGRTNAAVRASFEEMNTRMEASAEADIPIKPSGSTLSSFAQLLTRFGSIFAIAIGITLALCSHLVTVVREHDEAQGMATSTLDQLSIQALSSLKELQRCHATLLHIFAVDFPLAMLCFACIYLLKQTFAIPGSALLNVCAGAVLPMWVSFPFVSILTACGATFCYILSSTLLSEDMVVGACDRIMPGKLAIVRQKIDVASQEGQLFYVLLFFRVFPFTANWFLNLTSPWLDVPMPKFTLAALIGLLPYNFITVQAGAVLSTLESTKDLFDLRVVGSLSLLALGLLVPALMKKRQRRTEKQE